MDLTISDLCTMVRGADRYGPDHSHSGYDTALPSTPLRSVSTYSIDASKIEDPEICTLHFDDLSPDFPVIPDLADAERPQKLQFQMRNASGILIAATEPDSVIRAFTAGAMARRVERKLVLQGEVGHPAAGPESDSASDQSHQIRHVAFIMPSTASSDNEIPNDLYVPSSSDDSHDIEMGGSEEELGEAAAMDVYPTLNTGADPDPPIPDTFFLLTSDDDEPSATIPSQSGPARPPKIPRDPTTGKFIPQSFAWLLDRFEE